jgi:hypothetical protein
MFYNSIIACYLHLFPYVLFQFISTEIVIAMTDTMNQRIGQVKAGTTITLQ